MFKWIVLGIFGFVYAYLGWTLFGGLEPLALQVAGWLALLALFLAILWVPLVYWQSDREESTSKEILLQWIAFSSMGWLSFVLVLSVLRDFVAIWIAPDLHTGPTTLAILGASGVLFAWGALHARSWVSVRRVEIPLAALPPELDGFKIVQITDLHVGPTIRRPYVEKVVALANSCDADAIVLTGDIVDGMVKDLAPQVAPLAYLQSRHGAYYVTGNHEYYWEGPRWITHLRGLGIEPLLNRHVTLKGSLVLAGVPDPTAATVGLEGPDFGKALAAAPERAGPRVLLVHQPKFAPLALKAGFDLQLSGHTHGGQFIPWTWIASLVHKFPYGLKTLDSLSVYVSRGTGYWGPPVRLGSPAEVTLLVLRPRLGQSEAPR